MKFPYGIADFHAIRMENYFYIDRTDRIALIEETGKHLLFLRPRRFGKSLLLSMLKNYYDLALKNAFDALFGNLAIGSAPTALHNQYFVLEWDFSAVEPIGSAREIRSSLHRYVNGTIKRFGRYYQDQLPLEIEIYNEDALASFQSLLLAVSQTNHKLYLLIDEYDNFANELMMNRELSKERYQALVYGEGCLKALFKVVKSAAKGQGLDRAFITGVSPVVMSDITSGHNIAEKIDLEPEFNDLCGFTETEIGGVLEQIGQMCDYADDKVNEALAMMQRYYNGYRFTYHDEAYIYNPTLALYFMKAFQKGCRYPQEMLDENMAMDRNKLVYISKLPDGGQVILDALNEQKQLSVTRLARRFGVEDMLYAVKDNTFMTSLLYFFGMLTLRGKTHLGESVLEIPNLVAKKLYIESLKELILPALNQSDALQIVKSFYTTGDIQPICDFIEQHCFKAFDNRDYRWANELTVKTAFMALLFNDALYITDSETALERDYADMTLIVRPDMRQYQALDFLFEFKYIGLGENHLNGAKVKAMTTPELKALPVVKQQLEASQAKLKGYRQTLEKAYAEQLRLRCYSIVSVGFDRLVWREI